MPVKGYIHNTTREIQELHKNGHTTIEISKLSGVEYKAVYASLVFHGLKPVGGVPKTTRKNYFNEEYFNKIDSHTCAYFFGLVCADGNIQYMDIPRASYTLSINLQKRDGYILDEFLKELDANFRTKIKKRQKKHHQDQVWFSLRSKKLTLSLIEKGCGPRKSLTLDWPSGISKKYIWSFLRGYFDGDGCATIQKKGLWAMPKMYFCGSLIFCEKLYIFLKENKIKSCFSIDREGSLTATARVIIGGQTGLVRLRDLMYENDSVSLKRKKDILYAKI